MEFAEEQDARIGQDEEPQGPEPPKIARTDALLMMSMAANVFLAVLAAWLAVSGIGEGAASKSARNAERDITRLNAAIERLERTVEAHQTATAEQAARAQQAPTQASAGGAEAAPKMQRVLLPDGRLVIKAVQ